MPHRTTLGDSVYWLSLVDIISNPADLAMVYLWECEQACAAGLEHVFSIDDQIRCLLLQEGFGKMQYDKGIYLFIYKLQLKFYKRIPSEAY